MVAYVEDERVVVDTADYFANAPRLTAAEGLALLASGMTVMATGQGSDVLASAVDKLSNALVPDGHEILTVDVSAEHDLSGTLRRAVTDGRVVEIVYTTLSRGDTSTREIEPWTVFTSLGNWYVSGFCRRSNGERVVRLDRIQTVTVTDQRFDPPSSPPEPHVRYTPSEDDVTALIELSPAAFWVSDYYPVEIVKETPTTKTVRFSAYDASVAAQLLVRLGEKARLLEGQEVQAATRDLRQKLLAVYAVTTE
jgi:proteasome accessory factor C